METPRVLFVGAVGLDLAYWRLPQSNQFSMHNARMIAVEVEVAEVGARRQRIPASILECTTSI